MLGERPNQKERQREDVCATGAQLIDTTVPGGTVTAGGFRTNVDVALQYVNSWLMGNGAAAIYNLMEDAATAEISRGQLWQWIHHGAKLDDGTPATRGLYAQVGAEELERLEATGRRRWREAAEILERLVLDEQCAEILRLAAY